MKRKGVIIVGSSRSGGNTGKIASYLADISGFDLIDLKEKNIGAYDYEYQNKEDDFLPLIKEIIDTYETLVFATPVYWYAMSGIMKNFFDRFSDCVRVEKEIGRKFRGKSMAMISCGSGSEPIEGFDMPFIRSAEYLGMNYLGDTHTWIEEDGISNKLKAELNKFTKKKLLIGNELLSS